MNCTILLMSPATPGQCICQKTCTQNDSVKNMWTPTSQTLPQPQQIVLLKNMCAQGKKWFHLQKIFPPSPRQWICTTLLIAPATLMDLHYITDSPCHFNGFVNKHMHSLMFWWKTYWNSIILLKSMCTKNKILIFPANFSSPPLVVNYEGTNYEWLLKELLTVLTVWNSIFSFH